MPRQPEYVLLIEENQRAELIRLGAHVSVVKYTLMGTVCEVIVNNDEFEYIGEEEDDDDTEG